MSNELLQSQAAEYVGKDEDELFALLASETSPDDLYSPGGLIARGKAIFRTTVEQGSAVREVVCRIYRQRASTIDNSVELTVVIAAALMATPAAVSGLPVLPLSALLVKIGLAEMCRE